MLLHPNTFTIVPVKMDKEECKMEDKKKEKGHSRGDHGRCAERHDTF